jgi:hypothetical protein
VGGKGETYDAILNRLIDLAQPPRPAKPLTRPVRELVDFEPVD